jgi:hypothetical protein
MSSSLSAMRVEGDLEARKTRGDLVLTGKIYTASGSPKKAMTKMEALHN